MRETLVFLGALLFLPGQAAGDALPAVDQAALEAAPPGEGGLVRLSLFPEKAEVRGRDRVASFVVTGVFENGGVRDLTGEAAWSVSDAAVAAVDAGGVVSPIADGSIEVQAAVGSIAAAARVAVTHAGSDLPINFSNDIVPIFSKHGCNSGGCHGKSGGQNGFQLSLFGFTPSVDYASLARDSRGRRVFPAAPGHSLLLRKATGALPHGGGQRFPAGSHEYALLYRWMRSGMPMGKPEDPTVESIAVHPRHRILARGGRQQLRVTARYTDGHEEDVTRLAEYLPNDDTYLQVSASGLARALDLAGQGAILVRYKGQVGLFRAAIPTGVDVTRLPRPEPRNFIDRLVWKRLDSLGIPPSGTSTDAEFLRRASIDLNGTTPTAAEAAAFLEDPDPAKREKLVERLLDRTEYASYFALLWADVLRNQRGGEGRAAPQTIGFHRWIYEGLISNKPFDRFARELLCAEGNVADNPAVAWYRHLENPKELVDDTAQVFLGTRMQCARCHHHPFEKWGQEDYWRFAGFFSRLSRKNDRNSRAFTVSLKRGTSRLTDDEPTSASFKKTYEGLKVPGGPVVEETADDDPRQRLAGWMAAPENPLFARAVVNRYWKHFFGRGIVEPEDDLRDTNPPSNPELLDALAEDFARGGYDLKRLIRTICGSAAYGLSAVPSEHNRSDRQNFSRFQPRRLSAEVLLDAIDRVAGAKTRFSGALRESRAIDLPDESSRNYFLEVFGKPDRSSACACERSGDVTLSQVLHLLNSREVLEKIASNEGRAAQLAKDPRPEAEKVAELFLWAFARRPTEEETRKAIEHVAGEPSAKEAASKGGEAERRKAWEDLLWVLLNSKEFLFNR